MDINVKAMPAGRPLIWNDPEAFDKAVDEYFEDKKNPRTWSGLALHLGFSSRDSLNDYKEKPEFSDSVKKALTRIEAQYENKLHGTTPTGAIFALKNFGWKDKQEIDATNHNYNVTPTPEEAKAIKESLDKSI